MPNPTGSFVWYDLATTDMAAAERFYTAVLGWTAQDSGMPDMPYTLLSAGPTTVGGMMTLPPEMATRGVGPAWTGYIAVDNVDAAAAEVKDKGGAVQREADDIPGVGRFAVVADPQGAVFILFKGNGEAPPPPAPMTPGTIGWHELIAEDGAGVFPFYADMFGWTKDTAMDMGPMGTYQMFRTGGDGAVGGIMSRPPGFPHTCWTFYFNVDEIVAAIDRVTAHNGQVRNGPQEVPGGIWTAQCQDPQGAFLNLVGPKQA